MCLYSWSWLYNAMTFPRIWFFTCTVGKSQSISALVIWFDLSEVIWLLFKIQMKGELMQYELSYQRVASTLRHPVIGFNNNHIQEILIGYKCFFSFFLWMPYQPSWVISCQSDPCRRTGVVIFNPYMGRQWVSYFSLNVNVRARLELELALLRCHCPTG